MEMYQVTMLYTLTLHNAVCQIGSIFKKEKKKLRASCLQVVLRHWLSPGGLAKTQITGPYP